MHTEFCEETWKNSAWKMKRWKFALIVYYFREIFCNDGKLMKVAHNFIYSWALLLVVFGLCLERVLQFTFRCD
jgi:hypothetical protein